MSTKKKMPKSLIALGVLGALGALSVASCTA
jgi:hypothetical protein